MTIDIIINRPSRRTRTRACVDRTVWRNYVYRVYNLTTHEKKSPKKLRVGIAIGIVLLLFCCECSRARF